MTLTLVETPLRVDCGKAAILFFQASHTTRLSALLQGGVLRGVKRPGHRWTFSIRGARKAGPC